MARIPAPASSPGLPASLLRKLNTAQVFFPSTHLESPGFRICVEGSGPQSLCCLHPRGDKCPPRPMYLLPFYTGVSRGAALERDLRPPLSGILWPHASRAAPRPHFPDSLTILCPVSLKSQEYDGGGQVTPPPFVAAVSLSTRTSWKTVVSQAKWTSPLPASSAPSWGWLLGQLSCMGCDTSFHLFNIHSPAWLMIRT